MKNRTLDTLQGACRRAVILRFLSEDPDHAMETRLLRSALKAVSYGVPLRQVNEDAAWLELLGLVACENAEDMLIVRITRRGLDVVAGDETVDGVERSYMEM